MMSNKNKHSSKSFDINDFTPDELRWYLYDTYEKGKKILKMWGEPGYEKEILEWSSSKLVYFDSRYAWNNGVYTIIYLIDDDDIAKMTLFPPFCVEEKQWSYDIIPMEDALFLNMDKTFLRW